jgi:DNA-binding NarL/FixJ family response regulator
MTSQSDHNSISNPSDNDPAAHRLNVLIVDDHPIMREGLGALINAERDMRLCGEADNAADAIAAIEQLTPDVAIVDIALHGRNGIELVKDIKARRPNLPVIVLSMYEAALYGDRASHAGASAYLMKQDAAGNVINTIRQVAQGQTPLPSSTKPTPKPPLDRLSDRELEVLQLIGLGMGTRQIAEKLHLSIKTIESHREHLKTKLHLRTGGELIRYAVIHGMDVQSSPTLA